MQRCESIAKVKPGKLALSTKLHSAAWPDVLEMITKEREAA